MEWHSSIAKERLTYAKRIKKPNHIFFRSIFVHMAIANVKSADTFPYTGLLNLFVLSMFSAIFRYHTQCSIYAIGNDVLGIRLGKCPNRLDFVSMS